MRTASLLCALLLAWAALPQAAHAQGARAGRRGRGNSADNIRPLGEAVRFPLDTKTLDKVFRVRTAPGVAVNIMFPEGFAAPPSCGSCYDESEGGTPPKDARFVLRWYERGQYIAIKPLLRSREDGGAGPPADRYFTTLPVVLKSLPRPITIEVHYSRPEDADTIVHFYYPDAEQKDALVEKRVTELRAQDEAKYSERVAEGSSRSMRDMLLQTHQCRRVGKSKVESMAVFEVEELCHFGRKHFVVFSLTNRGNPALYPGTVLVTQRGKGREATPVDYHSPPHYQRELSGDSNLLHNDSLRGVVSFEVDERDDARRFEVRWSEVKGQRREITIPDVSF